MKEKAEQLRSELQARLVEAKSTEDVEALRVHYLGRKGPVQALMQGLRDATPDERPMLGALINSLKVEMTEACDSLHERLLVREEDERLKSEDLDVTLPGRRQRLGRMHPISAMLEEMLDIHRQLGFSVLDGPEVDTDYYNFEGLNFPPDHPARDMQDTFYVGPGQLLRTHTSNIQVRTMEKHGPPLRFAAPGRTFRNEDVTARSHVQFHQVEGVYIDRHVTFADLLSTLRELLARLFHRGIETRFRPSFFPFVEPGVEVDVACSVCRQEGCSICKGTGWLEVLGAGLVHPNVMKAADMDPESYSGYAWGIGIERLVMLRYGVRDIRLFFENDLRFLQQF